MAERALDIRTGKMVDKIQASRAEARALADPVRIRILRLCLHEALTNNELAQHLGMDKATVLHHVRTLVRTGYLAPAETRTGKRGAVEKPYTATGKSWLTHVPEDDPHHDSFTLAMFDAVRAEVEEAGAAAMLQTSRLGGRMSPAKVKRFSARIERLVSDMAAEPDDPDGEAIGFFVVLHKRTLGASAPSA